MWEEIRSLKKTKIGGYNKKSVIDFIKSVATEFTEYKVYSESAIKQINFRISAMTGEKIEITPDLTREFSVQEMMRSRAVIKEQFDQINEKLDELVRLYCKEENNDSPVLSYDENLVSQMIFESEVKQNISDEVDSIDAFFQELEKQESQESQENEDFN